jgi:divalent metal cation (Fe/Co/Zn/Cd) transporter
MQKLIRILSILIASSLLFGFGFFIGASKFNALMGDVKWTDVGSLVVTTFGLVFALLTYFRWLKSKIKDDAYLAAKRYLDLALSFKRYKLLI